MLAQAMMGRPGYGYESMRQMGVGGAVQDAAQRFGGVGGGLFSPGRMASIRQSMQSRPGYGEWQAQVARQMGGRAQPGPQVMPQGINLEQLKKMHAMRGGRVPAMMAGGRVMPSSVMGIEHSTGGLAPRMARLAAAQRFGG